MVVARMMVFRSGLVILVSASCGFPPLPQLTVDAQSSMADAPPAPAERYHYVVDEVNIPATNTQAREFGLDLDGDAVVDNQLGMVLATFTEMGIDAQSWFDKQIDTGEAIMLADLFTLDFASASDATFTIYQGSNPMPAACLNTQDTLCRRHLTGSASFTALATPVDPPLSGSFVNGVLAAGPGQLTIQLAFPDAPPTELSLVGARVKLADVSDTALGAAVLAGGVTQTDIDGKLYPALQIGFTVAVTADCTMLSTPPGCGCADNTNGKTYIGLFDSNNDCQISVDEIRTNSLFQSLFAPDVMLDGQMCLSVGVRAHAVRAGFVAPQ